MDTLATARSTDCCRIGIVDDDLFTLAALKGMIRAQLSDHGVSVAWTVRQGEKAVELCVNRSSRPDVVLVDMSMDQLDGLTVCRRIRTLSDTITLLAFTSHSLNHYRPLARRAGAQALLDKADPSSFRHILIAFANGAPCVQEGFLTPREASKIIGGKTKASAQESLTAKEIEVMDLSIQALTAKEVSQRIGVSESTVKTHIRNATAKLGARNKLEAVRIWHERQRTP